MVHRTDERLAATCATPTTLAPLAATLTLSLTGLTVKIRLTVTAKLPWLTPLLRLLSALALHLLGVAAAPFLAPATPSTTSTTASGVGVSIL
jgi:hypothetical protein